VRVVIIHPFFLGLLRGIERFAMYLSNGLAAREVRVDILTWQGKQMPSRDQLHPDIRVHAMPDIRYFMRKAAVLYYIATLLFRRFDWIVIFFAGYGEREAIALLRRVKKFRTCVILQYPGEEVPHQYSEFMQGGFLKTIDLPVAVSHHVAGGVRRTAGLPCHVVHNGVDSYVFQPSADLRRKVRAEMGISEDSPVIITVAALEERKGIQWLIRAAASLIKNFPSLQCWVVGEGGYRNKLEAEIRDLGLEDTIRLLGGRKDVQELLTAADIGCLLSHGEAMGIAVLEYMAVELPVVVSRDPPFQEIVPSGNGFIVDETCVPQVVEALTYLLHNPEVRRQYGAAGRARVLNEFTWDKALSKYYELLN
jgi:glycosyltransferase involved in cell wall biosynthesis